MIRAFVLAALVGVVFALPTAPAAQPKKPAPAAAKPKPGTLEHTLAAPQLAGHLQGQPQRDTAERVAHRLDQAV